MRTIAKRLIQSTSALALFAGLVLGPATAASANDGGTGTPPFSRLDCVSASGSYAGWTLRSCVGRDNTGEITGYVEGYAQPNSTDVRLDVNLWVTCDGGASYQLAGTYSNPGYLAGPTYSSGRNYWADTNWFGNWNGRYGCSWHAEGLLYESGVARLGANSRDYVL